MKVIAIASGFFLSALLTASIMNYKENVKSAEEQLTQTSLPLAVDSIYNEIEQNLVEPLLVSSLMAEDTVLRDWLLNGEKELSNMSKYLDEIQRKYALFTTSLVSDSTKNYYNALGIIDVMNQQNPMDSWFFNFKKDSKPHEIHLFYNALLGNSPILYINHKVMDYKNELIGIVSVGLKLFHIDALINSFKEKYKYEVYFLDTTGEITLFSKKLNKRGNISHIEGIKEFKDTIFSQKTTQIHYKNKDGNYHLMTKYIDNLKLHLVVEMDKKEYMDDLNKTLYTNIAISFLVTLLAIVISAFYIINSYQKRLLEMAKEDTLTGLANRRQFNEDFVKIVKRYQKNVKIITLIIIDIDDFKLVNDTFGHFMGDKVLKRVAQLIRAELRVSDMVARWGGEEFSILLTDVPKEESIKIAEKIRLAIKEDNELFLMLGKKLTISLGLGEMGYLNCQDTLVQKVDKALYIAKNEGKDKAVFV